MSASSRVRAGAIAALGAGALIVGFTVPAAGAVPTTADNTTYSVQAQVANTAHARQVATGFGAASGGVFLGDRGQPMVAVTNQADAAKARAAGVTPKLVKYTLQTLTATKNAMDAVHNVPQTSWGVDPSTNKVVVTILDSASPATSAKVTKAAQAYGDKVAIRHAHGHYDLFIAGGDSIGNGSVICSNGFNVTKGGQNYMLTAGHCTNEGGTWSGGDVSGGQIVESDCPGADSGLITNPNGSAPGQVNNGQAITSAGTPSVGQTMSKSGQTTGVTSGKVTGVDQSVNFDVGTLNHMTGAALHSDHGDSGGTGYAGSMGVGTLSGGDTQTTFFYPLQLELQAYGLSLAQ